MAYCNADTSAKIGFRPILQTDAFGAAHLSGYPSAPEGHCAAHLTGLGQGHNPFSPRTWQLHELPPWRLQGVPTEAGIGSYFYNRPFDASGWELYQETDPTLHGLGDVGDFASPDLGTIAIDPTTLAIGIAALAAGMFLFGGTAVPKMRKRRAAALRKRRDSLSRQISLLEA